MDGSGREEGWGDLDEEGGEGDEAAEGRLSGSGSGSEGAERGTNQPWVQDATSFENRTPPKTPPPQITPSPCPPRWESGKGRCAVTGRRVLGGTDGLRRVMV